MITVLLRCITLLSSGWYLIAAYQGHLHHWLLFACCGWTQISCPCPDCRSKTVKLTKDHMGSLIMATMRKHNNEIYQVIQNASCQWAKIKCFIELKLKLSLNIVLPLKQTKNNTIKGSFCFLTTHKVICWDLGTSLKPPGPNLFERKNKARQQSSYPNSWSYLQKLI